MRPHLLDQSLKHHSSGGGSQGEHFWPCPPGLPRITSPVGFWWGHPHSILGCRGILGSFLTPDRSWDSSLWGPESAGLRPRLSFPSELPLGNKQEPELSNHAWDIPRLTVGGPLWPIILRWVLPSVLTQCLTLMPLGAGLPLIC